MPSATTVTVVPHLTSEDVERVLALVDRAESVDGVRPVNEAAQLRLADRVDDGPTVHLLAGGGALAGYAQLHRDGDAAEVELVVHPAHRRVGIGRELVRTAGSLAVGVPLRAWAHGDLPAARALAASEGFRQVRALWRMQRDLSQPLPERAVPDGVRIRTFQPGFDEAAWLAVNGRAFATHPEQGRWTAADLDARMHEPWFDPTGFFLAEDVASGEILGFHWTKTVDGSGEVYVIGIDPAAQGRGLGTALTLAGLHHLRRRGVPTVDLYVESDNAAGLALYRRLGFGRVSVDAMYERR